MSSLSVHRHSTKLNKSLHCLSCRHHQTPNTYVSPELQIRMGIEYNFEIFFLCFNKSVCCDHSLEPSQINPNALRMVKTLWSFDRSECNRVKFLWKVIPKVTLLPFFIWRTVSFLLVSGKNKNCMVRQC